LELGNSIPTEANNLSKGFYTWISIDKLSIERLIVSQKVRVLVKCELQTRISDDILLVKNGESYLLGEVVLNKGKRTFISDLDNAQNNKKINDVTIVGKVMQIVLDL